MNGFSRTLRPRINLMILFFALTIVATPVWMAEATTITHISRAGIGEAAIERYHYLIEQYQAENPDITIDLMVVPGDHMDQLYTMFAGGLLPDVIDTYLEQQYFAATSGMFIDLNPIVDRDPDVSWNDFFEFVVDGVAFPDGTDLSGQRWLLPEQLQVVAAGFNHEQFAQSGLLPPSSWDYHWTWDDLQDLGRKLVRVDGEGNVQRYAAHIITNWARWPVWVHNAGGWHFDRYVDPTESHLTNEPTTTALEFLQQIFNEDRFASSSSVANFRVGNAPIGLSVGPSHTALHIDLENDWEYSYGPNPMLVRGGSEMAVYGRSIGSQSDNVDEAWQWMKYLTIETAEEMVRMTSTLPAWIPAAREYVNWVPGASPWEQVWIDLLMSPDAYVRPVIDTPVRNQMQVFINQIINGESAVPAALEQAHGVVSSMLND